MEELEQILKDTQSFENRLITTDGVFSMDGHIANLKDICYLAKKYNALVHVDDSHADFGGDLYVDAYQAASAVRRCLDGHFQQGVWSDADGSAAAICKAVAAAESVSAQLHSLRGRDAWETFLGGSPAHAAR